MRRDAPRSPIAPIFGSSGRVPDVVTHPSFMAIGSGVLLPGVAEIPTFPILSELAYTTGLGYRPTCEMDYALKSASNKC